MHFRRFQGLSGLLAAAMAWLAFSPAALAHPHVFIDYSLGLRQQAGQIQGFELVWILDQDNTDLVLTEFDADANGKLDPHEAAGAAALMLQDMSEYDFFSEVLLDGRPLPIEPVQQIEARLEQNRIVYRLFLPCAILPSSVARTLSFKAIDPSNYVAFKPDGQAAQLQGRGALRLQVLQPARQTYDAWTFQLGGN